MAGVAAIPASDRGWVGVSGDSEIARGPDLHDIVGRRADVVVGMPASEVSTFAVALPPTDQSLHANMIFAQAEKRGLVSSADGETLVDYELIGNDPEGDTFAVTVMPPPASDFIENGAAGYTTSAWLRSAPTGGCCLWKESGRLVFGVYHGQIPIHVQVLSGGGQPDKAAAQEISLTLLGLRGDPALSGHQPKEMDFCLPDAPPEAVKEFSEALDIPVTQRMNPNALSQRVEGRSRLLPHAVSDSRRKRKSGRRVFLGLVALLIAYVVAISWLWIDARNKSRKIESIERQLSITEPDVERIQMVEQRWKALEPAFEKDLFPLVQLSRITSALPGSGVVIREFKTSGRSSRIVGQARDVQLANQLLEDLQVMEGFERYQWSMPNPKVEKNNTATFVISGEPKNAGPDS
jgi:hypothetical protein